MRNFLLALLKYIEYHPKAELYFIYKIKSRLKNGELAVTYTKDKRLAHRYKKDSDVEVSRKLMCRTF